MDPDLNPSIPPPTAPGQRMSVGGDIPTAAIPGQAPKAQVSQPGAAPVIAAPTADQTADGSDSKAANSNGGSGALGLLGNKKLLVIVGGGVVALLLLIIVVVAAGGGTPTTPTKRVLNTVSQSPLPEKVNRPDGSLDLSRRVSTDAVIHGQKITASGGQQVNLSSGLSVLVEAIGDYSSSANLPDAGKKFVIILITVGNHALTGNLSTSYLDFKLQDKTGKLLSPNPLTQAISNNPLAVPVDLKPGAQVEGRLVYQVGSDELGWNLVHKETYRKSSDNTTFDVECDILLNLHATTDSAGASGPTDSTPTTGAGN